MIQIRAALVQLAQQEPAIRAVLVPVLKQADKWKTMPKGWDAASRTKFWESLTGDNKHKVTKCISEMDGKVDDPGAFCASLADRVMGKDWRSKKAGLASKIPTASLPTAVLKVLQEVRFSKRQISVSTATEFSMYSAGDDGAKGFTALIDLDTQQSRITWGAFGGGALGQKPTPVDDVNTPKKPLPDHLAVVQGQIGGRDPYASITVTPKALPRLVTPGRRANGDMMQYFADNPDKLAEKLERDKAQKQANAGSAFITAKTLTIAKAIYAAIKDIKASWDDKPDVPSNVGGVIARLFAAWGNQDAYRKLHLFFGNMSGVGSGFGQDDELRDVARRFVHGLNEGEMVAVGMILLRAAKRPNAAMAFEKWAEHNLDLAKYDPAAAAAAKMMSPGDAFDATITQDIMGMATWAWDKVGKKPGAAESFASALAEDVNWHSLRAIGSPDPESVDYANVSAIGGRIGWTLEGTAAVIVALLRLAGLRGKAEAVKKEALRAFKDSYQAQTRVASRYLRALERQGETALVGKTFENQDIRVHVYRSVVMVWDLANAGKRGKTVEKLSLYNLDFVRDPEVTKQIDQWTFRLKSLNYAQAKAQAETLANLEAGAKFQVVNEKAFDILPAGIKPIKLETPQVSIEADLTGFSVRNKVDTNNLPTCIPASQGGKQSIGVFFRWLQDNLAQVKGMTYSQVLDTMRSLGIKYHSYCAMD